jgi:hypothetical protein
MFRAMKEAITPDAALAKTLRQTSNHPAAS